MQKPSGLELSAPTADGPFSGGSPTTFSVGNLPRRLDAISVAPGAHTTAPKSLQGARSGLRGSLLEGLGATFGGQSCAMLYVRTTYYLLCFDHIRQGLGIVFSAAGEASQRRGDTVCSFFFFLSCLGRHAAPKGRPKGPQGLPKPPPKHPKIVLKFRLGPTCAPKLSRRSKKVPA